MSDYTIRRTLPRPFEETVEAVRAQLAEVGFGILTEIDIQATLKQKLDVHVSPQLILGACRPQLAHRALEADPSVATLLPCNVVVRAMDEATTVVEAVDPSAMISISGAADDDGVHAIATDARERLTTALAALEREN